MLRYVAAFTLGIALLALAAGAHDAQQAPPEEWWRVFGHLQAVDGRRFDVSASFFRFALPHGRTGSGVRSAWQSDALVPATFVVVDERARRAYPFTRLERTSLGLAWFASVRPNIRVGDWSLEGNVAATWRRRHFALHVAAPDVALELQQTPLKPPIRYGVGGTLQTGSCAACVAREEAYTRSRAHGTLTLSGQRYALTGTTWIDHESSSHELARDDAGWDRFEIQLDDGRDIDLRIVRHRDGKASPASSGVIVAADGRLTRLHAGDFVVENPLHTRWRSRRTGIAYPSLWEIIVSPAHLDFAVVPPLQDQEISAPDRPAYYDGTIEVERAPAPGGDPGHGYVELSGYDRPLRL